MSTLQAQIHRQAWVRALQYLDMLGEDPERTFKGNQSTSMYVVKHPGTKLSKHGLVFMKLSWSSGLAHIMLTKPCALVWIWVLESIRSKVIENLSSYFQSPFNINISKFKISPLTTDLSVCNAPNCGSEIFTVGVKITQNIFIILKTFQWSEEYSGMWPKQ